MNDNIAVRFVPAQPYAVDEKCRQIFDDFARARMPELLRLGHALTGSVHAGADLVQDALERTMLAWGRVQNQADPEGYVRRIMVNRNISIWRRRHHEALVLDTPELQRRADPRVTEPLGRDLALWARVRALPPRQRTVIVLRYYEDMSDAQIAATMGSAVGTVKSQGSRALAALRRDAVTFTEMTPNDVVRSFPVGGQSIDQRGTTPEATRCA